MLVSEIIPECDGVGNGVHEMVESLRSTGLLKIQNHLSRTTLDRLNREFEWILAQDARQGIKPMELGVGRGADVHRCKIGDVLPATHEIFSAAWMQNVGDIHWGTKAFLNGHIYVMHEVVGTKHVAQDLHFDVQKTLKFFLYLNDVTAENGAFSCVPGSHLRTESIREQLRDEISYDNRHLTREHPYSESDIVPVEGEAGTLIVFTTDVWHRAGVVRKGERKVMRGHTRPAIQGTSDGGPQTGNDSRERFVNRMMRRVGRKRR